MKPWKQYDHSTLHRMLINESISMGYKDGGKDISSQALFCPYYVALEGALGSDWGVIVNPDSERFSLLTFEHDDCGCPEMRNADGSISDYKHPGAISQEGDTWDLRWEHRCTEGWCDKPCEIKEMVEKWDSKTP